MADSKWSKETLTKNKKKKRCQPRRKTSQVERTLQESLKKRTEITDKSTEKN